MKYFSLNHKASLANFETAVRNGLAPDKGLYFPEEIPILKSEFFDQIQHLSSSEIAFEVIKPFIGDEIPEKELKRIIKTTLSFDFPLVTLAENIFTLELFHGPTLAFKDVGARFMARCLSYFNSKQNSKRLTVLVATSGDTGGAVADGFLGVEGVDVVVLYPKGKVSEIQQAQFTTLGKNIIALEVDGVFDDCQKMVKQAFVDKELNNNLQLTSANSINIARWLPQMFYYFIVYKEHLYQYDNIVFSVPSGNFGNICAGLMAWKMGLPAGHFIASTNINQTIPNYMKTEIYDPKTAQTTISNAMDVSDPSNFIRIQQILNNNFQELNKILSSKSYNDTITRLAMKEMYEQFKYIADPHGAVGYLGLKDYINGDKNIRGVFLETAHPLKFLSTVEDTLGIKLYIPKRIEEQLKKKKHSIPVNNYNEFKNYLLTK